MTARTYDPRREKSRDMLVREADDIDRAIAGDLDNDPRSATGAACSNPSAQRNAAEPAPSATFLAA